MGKPKQNKAKQGNSSNSQAVAERSSIVTEDSIGSTPGRWLWPALLFGLAFLAFWPALSAEFVDWDDDRNFVQNEAFRGLSREHLNWMFGQTHVGHWQPLTWMSLAIDYKLFGLNAGAFHRTSMLLHACNALLLFYLCQRFLRRSKQQAQPHTSSASPALWTSLCCAIGTGFFAWHPLRAESVAWATERRDVLAGFFLLACMHAWLSAVGNRHAEPSKANGQKQPRDLALGAYFAALGLFALSLGAKAWGITLPAVLLLLDWWPLTRHGPRPWRRLILEKLPFLGLAFAAAWKAYRAQALGEGGQTAVMSLADHGLAERCMQAAYGAVFYLHKSLWPTNLAPLYELEPEFNLMRTRYLVSAAVFVILSALLLWRHRSWRPALVAWSCFLILVSPVLGWVQSGAQIAADRYTYIACLPFAIALAAVLQRLGNSGPQNQDHPQSLSSRAKLIASVSAAILIALFIATWKQTGIWKNSETLWTHSIAAQPDSYVAHFNWAAGQHRARNLEAAQEGYRRSVERHPGEGNFQARLQLGNLLRQSGQLQEAQAVWLEGLSVDPQTWDLITALQPLYQNAGKAPQLIELWEAGILADPGDPGGPFLYGNFLANLGRETEALQQWERTVRMEPRADLAWSRIANTHHSRGRIAEAERAYRRAIQTSARAEYALGLADVLIKQSKGQEAASWAQYVLTNDPQNARAQELLRQGRALPR